MSKDTFLNISSPPLENASSPPLNDSSEGLTPPNAAKKGFHISPIQPWFGSESDHALHIALYQPEIPGNTGNIGRLCAGAGGFQNIWLHLIKPLGFELENKYLRRAGLDYWPNVNLCLHENIDTFLSIFPPNRLYLLSKKAENFYHEVTYKEGSVLLFGRETKGLPDELLQKFRTQTFKIPITEHVRSLNLSNACAIVLYEALRQRDFQPLFQDLSQK